MTNPRIPYQLGDTTPLAPPRLGGRPRPLIVHVVVNVEHWVFDEPMPRKIITPPHGVETEPDVPNFAWAEYGMRRGLPRILEALAARGIVASTSCNASVIDAYPAAAEVMRDAGWEFIGHGMRQKSLGRDNDERSLIARCLEKLNDFTGRKTRGWLSPGLRETHHTPDHLKALGVQYLCDWVVDDLPCWMNTNAGPLIAMPYSLEINDSIVFAIEKHSSAEMHRRLSDTITAFESELLRAPRVLSLGLHPHLIGVPHRIGYLHRMLDLLQAREDVIFLRGGDIADWFLAENPAPKSLLT